MEIADRDTAGRDAAGVLASKVAQTNSFKEEGCSFHDACDIVLTLLIESC
jgi:hypothetical protein